MKHLAPDFNRFQFLRRAVAGVVVAGVPLLFLTPGSALHYNAIWNATINDYWGGIALDAAMAAACLVSPLNTAACAALAVF
jgi:hypothetical protein